MKRLAIVILNWNGVDFLRKFLPSVTEHSKGDHITVWVADNGSEDNSLVFLKEHYPQVSLLEFDINHGFAGGYNKALSLIRADYYILLNSDAAVSEGWTGPLFELMENNPDVAACMPKIKSYNRPEYFEHAGAAGGFIDFLGYPFCRGRIFDVVEKDSGQYDDAREIFWATGACMMVRAGDWHASGGFDEKFFAHMEEIDMCWRLKNMGKKIMVCPSSVVFHLGGGTLPQLHPRKTFLNFRNSLLMLLKNLPSGKWHWLVLRLFMDGLSVIKFLMSLSFSNAFAIVKSHLSFFANVPYCLRERKKLKHQLQLMRSSNPELPVYENHKEIYRRSIVADFFLLKRKYFSRLDG